MFRRIQADEPEQEKRSKVCIRDQTKVLHSYSVYQVGMNFDQCDGVFDKLVKQLE